MFITLSIFLFKEIIKIIIGRHIYGIIIIKNKIEQKKKTFMYKIDLLSDVILLES
jgi:hypothetical protein